MATIKGTAPAKVNLTLHVTGQRDDGYHLLDSLVVFAGVADKLGATIAPDMRLQVSGPFAAGVPTDDSNLVMRAARALQQARGVRLGTSISLEKNLPHAAGIGSGSSDAAITLTMLAELWDVPPLAPDAPEVLALGADLPVCLRAPNPIRMSGIGDMLEPVASLPKCALVLVRPPVAVPTQDVFKALKQKNGSPMETLPKGLDFEGFAAWLGRQRNDLLAPATRIAPVVTEAIDKLASQPDVAFAGMSGSGATCYALVPDMGIAKRVAKAIQISQMNWWVAPAAVM